MKELVEALEFYVDNGVDEVICEEEVGFFGGGEDFSLEALGLVNQGIGVKKGLVGVKRGEVEKGFEREGFGGGARATTRVAPTGGGAVKSMGGGDSRLRGNDNGGVKKVGSTFEAISGLAARAKNGSAFGGGAFGGIGGNLNGSKFMALDDIVKKAKEAAAKCKDLAELKKAVEEFDGCSLKKMATNTVFCDGNPESKVMVIGEAPGNHEDLQGIPFCGDSGKLLDAMFGAINMKRADDYYITNVLFWRPPGNRRPTDEELKICRPFVERHIELVDPRIIILVGATSMAAVLGMKEAISKVRGKVLEFDAKFMDKKIDSFVIFHPSYLMRQSGKKRVAWRDMLKLEGILKG